MGTNGDNSFDLEGFKLFRDACLDQWLQQNPTHSVLEDGLPTIIHALDDAIDEIERLRALVDA